MPYEPSTRTRTVSSLGGADQPRPEYPRPQMVRERWLNLNGRWEFEIDHGDSGIERGLDQRALTDSIIVPFCPESELSGHGHVDFMEAVWYARDVVVPQDWADDRVLLHFGAVDHDTTVWVNGAEVARHRGGFSSFHADITDALAGATSARIVVRARDTRYGAQARGKQSIKYANEACDYTRTTGIWQTVWLEPVPRVHLRRPRIVPGLADRSLTVTQPLSAAPADWRLRAVLTDDAGDVAAVEQAVGTSMAPSLRLVVPTDRVRPWSPTDPHLYGLRIELLDDAGSLVDRVDSYAGLRSVAIDGQAILLNGERVFQRLVLDQGYWPDSLMTAPSDAALVHDLELITAAGFNGARVHQKVAEERYLYHADRLGVLIWGEFGDWGIAGRGARGNNQQPTASFITQWAEVLERDLSHPSIIGWCPLNETYQEITDRITQLDDVTAGMFQVTKAVDPTRPVIDSSGYSHRVRTTDVWDSHSYEQDPVRFATQQAGLAQGTPYGNTGAKAPYSVPYEGQPYFVSEYGGIWWNPDAAEVSGADREESWGYGQRVVDEEEFQARFAGLTNVLLDDPLMFGYCYTQLTDVFQEQNGIYRFDRSEKLDVSRVAAVQQRPAAYEEADRATTFRTGHATIKI
ncbi:glycoside hydrolase family 2 protein [Microlunatus sp. Y2014]|uniref:glycoside hydrolase family 2 protein n=1 Tax=Microlunatus sp. Y2014 TaxID=3418488 RepID=UPI003DA70094